MLVFMIAVLAPALLTLQMSMFVLGFLMMKGKKRREKYTPCGRAVKQEKSSKACMEKNERKS